MHDSQPDTNYYNYVKTLIGCLQIGFIMFVFNIILIPSFLHLKKSFQKRKKMIKVIRLPLFIKKKLQEELDQIGVN